MANSSKDLEDLFKETLAGLLEASGALATGPKTGRRPASADVAPGAKRWLATPSTLLLFRTSRGAADAGEQARARGYEVTLFQRYLLIEAPWLFVAGLLASVGLDRALLAIHWEHIDDKNGTPHE
jgi:hypothetical protein